MQDLIESLQIFQKYFNEENPTCCENDVLHCALGLDPDKMEPKDIKRLEELSWSYDPEHDDWYSYRFG